MNQHENITRKDIRLHSTPNADSSSSNGKKFMYNSTLQFQNTFNAFNSLHPTNFNLPLALQQLTRAQAEFSIIHDELYKIANGLNFDFEKTSETTTRLFSQLKQFEQSCSEYSDSLKELVKELLNISIRLYDTLQVDKNLTAEDFNNVVKISSDIYSGLMKACFLALYHHAGE